jgi:ribosomal protein L19
MLRHAEGASGVEFRAEIASEAVSAVEITRNGIVVARRAAVVAVGSANDFKMLGHRQG